MYVGRPLSFESIFRYVVANYGHSFMVLAIRADITLSTQEQVTGRTEHGNNTAHARRTS